MLFGSVRKPLLLLCILGLKTFVSMQAGKTSQKITQKHTIPCPTLRKHKAFCFLFLFFFSLPLALLSICALRNISSMPQSSLGGSTCTSSRRTLFGKLE